MKAVSEMSRFLGPTIFALVGVFLIVTRHFISAWTARTYSMLGLEKFMWPRRDQLPWLWLVAGIVIIVIAIYDLLRLFR